MTGWLALLGLLLAAGAAAAEERLPASWRDMEGRDHAIASAGAPTVLLVALHDCPAANRSWPQILRLQQEFPGCRFLVVVPDSTSGEVLRRWQTDYGGLPPILQDPRQELTRALGATRSPEAVVLLRGRLVYRGRIDDRQQTLTVRRAAARRHDLREVLQELRAGRVPAFRTTRAVGCHLPPPAEEGSSAR